MIKKFLTTMCVLGMLTTSVQLAAISSTSTNCILNLSVTGTALINLSSPVINLSTTSLSAGYLSSPFLFDSPLIVNSYLSGSATGKHPTGQTVTLTQSNSSTTNFYLDGAVSLSPIMYTVFSNIAANGSGGNTQLLPSGTANLINEQNPSTDNIARTLSFTIPSGQVLVGDNYTSTLTFTQGVP